MSVIVAPDSFSGLFYRDPIRQARAPCGCALGWRLAALTAQTSFWLRQYDGMITFAVRKDLLQSTAGMWKYVKAAMTLVSRENFPPLLLAFSAVFM